MPPNELAAPRPPSGHRLKLVALAAGVAAVAIVVVGVLDRVHANQSLVAWTNTQAIPTVTLAKLKAESGASSLQLPGTVQAFSSAPIHARTSGYLKRWYTDIGTRVRAGQVLAEIDTPELDQQLLQAQADLATAVANQKLSQSTATRWKGLVAQDAVSKQEADEKDGDLAAKNALVTAAEANVRRLQAMAAFKRILAPFDGIVTQRSTDVGALISVGGAGDAALFTVADVHRLRIYVRVPQSYSAAIHTGLGAKLTVPEYPGKTFTASVANTSGAVSDQSGTLLVELQTDNVDGMLKPGEYAEVTLDLPQSGQVVQVPASAVMFRHEGMSVATIDAHDHVVMKPLTISRDLGAAVEVSAGVSLNDRVIDSPPDSLSAGDLVRIAGASAEAGKVAVNAAK